MYSILMNPPSQEELRLLEAAGRNFHSDQVVQWESAYGLIIIETRGGKVFVNGDPVLPVDSAAEKGSS